MAWLSLCVLTWESALFSFTFNAIDQDRRGAQ